MDNVERATQSLDSDPAPGRWFGRLTVFSLATAAVCAVLVINVIELKPTVVPATKTADDEFRAKGTALATDTFVGLTAYRVLGEGEVRHLGQEMHADDPLAFAYSNQETAHYLMIFAIDAAGKLHWYYPDEGGRSIEIQRGQKEVELPDQVRHDLAPGPMTIYALFTVAPLQTSQVESVDRGVGALDFPELLGVHGGTQQALSVNVR